jgi:pyruvate dehydrogenase E1 component alpha subunit
LATVALQRRATNAAELSAEYRRSLFEEMLLIRMVEEAIADHYAEGEMRCPVHLSIGQEAVAVGVCRPLTATDKVFSTHRCHAHYLAKGGDLKRMFAEIYGKKSGCLGGRGGSMHLADFEVGMMASIPIVSSAIPVAVGSALADKRVRSGKVTVAFFGDASVEEGVFHESANFASLHKLPVVFACENNLYSVYTPLHQRQPDRPLTDVARAHGLRAMHVDGNDAEQVFHMAHEAIALARSGGGPTFLVLDTYRSREHCGPNTDDALGYRPATESAAWEQRCPLRRLKVQLLDEAILTAEHEADMRTKIGAKIEEARTFAREAPLPSPDDATRHVYA